MIMIPFSITTYTIIVKDALYSLLQNKYCTLKYCIIKHFNIPSVEKNDLFLYY